MTLLSSQLVKSFLIAGDNTRKVSVKIVKAINHILTLLIGLDFDAVDSLIPPPFFNLFRNQIIIVVPLIT